MAIVNKSFTKKYYINEEGVRRVIETKTTRFFGIPIIQSTKDKRARIQPIPETPVTAEEVAEMKDEFGIDNCPEGDTEPS